MTPEPPDPRSVEGWPNPVDRLRAIVGRLRGPGGCPWDIEQDHHSIRSALVEECYEVIEAIESSDDANLLEELGDLLLHVTMHSQMAAERRAFDFDAVATGICDKLIRRHPHVFGGDPAGDVGQVLARWEEIKRKEKLASGRGQASGSVFDSVPGGLPSVPRAFEAQKKAAKLGLDWPSREGVMAKLAEELGELRAAGALPGEAAKIEVEKEIGDILFTGINLARSFGVDPEHALRDATNRFLARARAVEAQAAAEGIDLGRTDAAEIDLLWERAKQSLASPGAPRNTEP